MCHIHSKHDVIAFYWNYCLTKMMPSSFRLRKVSQMPDTNTNYSRLGKHRNLDNMAKHPCASPTVCNCTFSSKAAILSFKCSCRRSLDSVRSLSTVSDNLLLCSSFIFSLCLALCLRKKQNIFGMKKENAHCCSKLILVSSVLNWI